VTEPLHCRGCNALRPVQHLTRHDCDLCRKIGGAPWQAPKPENVANEDGVMKYNHSEAFKLMKYASKKTGPGPDPIVEYIWNSRDGVTPFVVASRLHNGDFVEMQHAEWMNDVYHPYYPHVGLKVGDRIFADMTVERGREIARRQIDLMHSTMPSTNVETPEEIELLISDMVKEWMDIGDPIVVTVDEAVLARLRRQFPMPIMAGRSASGRYA